MRILRLFRREIRFFEMTCQNSQAKVYFSFFETRSQLRKAIITTDIYKIWRFAAIELINQCL